MDDEGCGIEEGGIWKNITVARSNGMDGTTRSCPPSIIHWPDRYVWVCRPCVCARTKTEEGMGGEMSGGDRWNVDGVKRGYKRRGGVESEGRFKTLLRGKDVVRMWGDFECESPTIPGRGCWQNCRICGGRIFPRCIYIYVCVCGNFRKIFL